MVGILILTILFSTILNTISSMTAKPLYEVIAASGFFDADRYFVMSEYCENMTEKARSGEYHDFFTRDDKIENLTDILLLSEKSNPCIVGGKGVGKTALVEGLAYRIAHDNVSENMKNKKIFKVNIAKLIVGKSGVKGSILTRLRAILNNAKSDKDIILFIDNIYQISQIPGVLELIQTYLDKGDIKIIVSATDEQYTQMMKNDAFAQDYTYIFLEEPNKFDTFRILKYLKSDAEKKQHVKIFDEVLMDIVNLTGRYMKNKFYPNKAVDILNLALVTAQKKSKGDICQVKRGDVIDAISEVTNIPIGDLSADEAEALETMNNRVKKFVIGQDHAVDIVCSAVKRSRLGFCDENKPRASFMFVGPPGVGKSELARVIGEEIGSFISVDMLGIGYKHSLKNLVGSSESKSELIEKIMKNPYSVVMFDNINSADSAELSVIYEILDRGFLTDFSGKKVDFTNAIVIMVVNSSDANCNINSVENSLKQNVIDNFDNNIEKKIDNVIFFNNLLEENYNSIVKMKLSGLENRLFTGGIGIKIPDEVVAYIRKLSFEEKNLYGARTIDKIITENIEHPISDLMIRRKLKSEEQIICNLDGDKIKFEITKIS